MANEMDYNEDMGMDEMYMDEMDYNEDMDMNETYMDEMDYNEDMGMDEEVYEIDQESLENVVEAFKAKGKIGKLKTKIYPSKLKQSTLLLLLRIKEFNITSTLTLKYKSYGPVISYNFLDMAEFNG
jgi:hypothetical protein